MVGFEVTPEDLLAKLCHSFHSLAPPASIGEASRSIRLTSKQMAPGGNRARIVDDEPIARRVLREELELFLEIAVVGEVEDGKDALQKIEKLQPEVVFLDLQMRGMGGFEVVRNLSGPNLPVIVIITAFDEQVIEAFEAGAIGYLLKPVSAARLPMAVDRARNLLDKPGEIAVNIGRIASVQPPSMSAAKRSSAEAVRSISCWIWTRFAPFRRSGNWSGLLPRNTGFSLPKTCERSRNTTVFMHLAFSQSLGNAGTIAGSVVDPSGVAVEKAVVTIHNLVTGYSQSTTIASDGTFRLTNIRLTHTTW